MKVVCKLGRLVLDTAHKAVQIGITTDELDQMFMRQQLKMIAIPPR